MATPLAGLPVVGPSLDSRPAIPLGQKIARRWHWADYGLDPPPEPPWMNDDEGVAW